MAALKVHVPANGPAVLLGQAARLAGLFGLEVTTLAPGDAVGAASECRLEMEWDENWGEARLQMRLTKRPGEGGASPMGPVFVDFVGGEAQYRRVKGGGMTQAVARAVGFPGAARCMRRLEVVDATAGLGRDAFVLASLGCNVTMVERSSVVAALLQDGLDRGSRIACGGEGRGAAVREICSRMRLVHKDSVSWMTQDASPASCDVVYIDPMYPDADQRTAAPRKELQLLQLLLKRDDHNEERSLLQAAKRIARDRVVLKRPRVSSAIDKPDIQFKGSSTRFDVYTSKNRRW